MRWKATREGETRVRKCFLIIPRCIMGEWRWLEIAHIKERYEFCEGGYWRDIEWVEGEVE